MQALLLLGLLQTRIQAGESGAVPGAMTAAAAAITAASIQPPTAISGAHLRLHYEVLRAAWLLQRGDTMSLMAKGEPCLWPGHSEHGVWLLASQLFVTLSMAQCHPLLLLRCV